MKELFRRYNPTTPPEERRGSPVCVASYPEACGESAVGEGWDLPLCEAHWTEAEMAARYELSYAVGSELDTLISAEETRPDRNLTVVEALDTAVVPRWGLDDRGPYEEALAAAFPTEGREDLTDPETLIYDYGRFDGDGPVEWWEETRVLLLRFLRQASERGLSGLTLELERLRERATVQLGLAEYGMDRRYTAPKRATRTKGGGDV